MGIQFEREKCTGCGKCVDICPGDLLYLDSNGQCCIRNQADCWDCMACVKECPTGALETRLAYSLAAFGARLIPKVKEDEIVWECIYPDGDHETFSIPR